MLGGQRQAGGRPDDPPAIPHRNDHRPGRGGKGGQIFPLIIETAVVKIGEVAEHRDAQARDVGQRRLDCSAGQDIKRRRHRLRIHSPGRSSP